MPGDLDQLFERARKVPIADEAAERHIVLKRSGQELIGPCPRCGGTNRFAIRPREGLWNCRGCKPSTIAGDVIGMVMWLDDCNAIEAAERLTDNTAVAARKANGHASAGIGKIDDTYDYEDDGGVFRYQVVRFEHKQFRQRRLDGNGGWKWSISGVAPLLYRLPELLEDLAQDRPVLVVEGEKDVNTARRRGLPATCNSGGAGKFPADLAHWFAGADVIVVADNDPQRSDPRTGKPMFHPDGRPVMPGIDHANDVAQKLAGTAAKVRVLDLGKYWPQCPSKGDISDFFAAGNPVEALWAIVDQLPDWTPPDKPGDKPAAIPVVQAFPIDGSKLPRRAWLVPGLLMRGQVTVIIAPPGIGKSLLTLQLAIISAAKISWAGWHPRDFYRTLIVNIEEDQIEMRRRLFGAATRMGVDQSLLEPKIILAEATSIVVAKADSRTKTVTATPILETIIQAIIINHIAIAVVDPFAETWAGDENSNSELKWCAVLWREVARRTNCCILLVHHAKKYAQNMAGDMDAGRGGGALAGVARIMATLFTMTEDEATGAGVSAEDRLKYVRFDDAKTQYSAMIAGARWFEKVSVGIGNAGDGIPEDDVGVLVPWTPPDIISAMTIAQANGILDQLRDGCRDDDGRPTGDPFCPTKKGGAKRWAGTIIQETLQCDEDAAKRLLAMWKKSGLIEEYQAAVSTSKGALRGCVRINENKRPGNVQEWT